jgi:hypothetical protein
MNVFGFLHRWSALTFIQVLMLVCFSAGADEPAGPASPASAASTASTPSTAASSGASAVTAHFTSSGAWEHAGYNSDEIVYSVFIESQDDRILRCRTHMQGYFVNGGKKVRIEDQQLSTVFPRQRVQAGIWMDMDEASGAVYQVRCRPN